MFTDEQWPKDSAGPLEANAGASILKPVPPQVGNKGNKVSALSAMLAISNLDSQRQLNPAQPKMITRAELVHTFEDSKCALRALAISPDGSTLYSGGEDKSIRVWSVASSGCGLQHTLSSSHSGWIWALVLSPDGHLLFSASGDCTIRMWAVNQAGCAPEPSHTMVGHKESVCSLAISKDSAFLYSGSDDKTIRVWDVSAGTSSPPQLLQILTGHTGYVSSLALSPDCCTLYSAGMSGDNTIKMWRVCGLRSDETPLPSPCKLLGALTAHTMGVYTITLSPDGKLLYSGGEDKSILIWSVNGEAGTGHLLRSLDDAHDKWVRSVRLTPDGHTLISGSADSTIGLWAVDRKGSASLLQVLRRHTDRVRCVRVSPDARYLFSASSDRTVRSWQLISDT